jgi:hypothetical protein
MLAIDEKNPPSQLGLVSLRSQAPNITFAMIRL